MTRRRAKQRKLKASSGWAYHGPRVLSDFSSAAKMAVRAMRLLAKRVQDTMPHVADVVGQMIRRRNEMIVNTFAQAGRQITLLAARKLDNDE